MDPTQELIRAIESQTRLLEKMYAFETSWRRRLLAGLLTGLGSTIGVSIVLAAAAYLLKPYADNIFVRDIIERPVRR
ncbi:MAG: hypothetical protein JSS66_11595 [Armatimonadetes bacterium]|nr:hypothetical protein [Armatimonadota bacterium]